MRTLTAQPCWLCKKYDYRCGTNGWCYLGVFCCWWPNAANKRTHSVSRQVGVPYIVVFLNKADMCDDAELINWWNGNQRIGSTCTNFQARCHADYCRVSLESIGRRYQWNWLCRLLLHWSKSVGQLYSSAKESSRWAHSWCLSKMYSQFQVAVRGNWSYRTCVIKVGQEIGDRRYQAYRNNHLYWCWNVPVNYLDEGQAVITSVSC